VCIYNVGYFVIRLYTTRIKCIITLLSPHVSALLGHHQVTNVYNYDINNIQHYKVAGFISNVFSLPKFCVEEYKKSNTLEADVGGRLEFR
jgi:hypothetical protein